MTLINKGFSAALSVALAAGASSPALAQDDFRLTEDGIVVGDDDSVEVSLGGRLHLDGYVIRQDGIETSGVDFRRLRPDLRINIANIVRFRVEREFTGTDSWRNLYAEVRPLDGLRIRGGQIIAPFGMEHTQSANRISFAERSLASGLAQDYGLGVQAAYVTDRFTVRIAYMGNAINGADYGEGISARATWLPVDSGDTRLHLGIAVDRRDYGAGDTQSFTASAGSKFAGSIFDTGVLTDLDSRTGIAGEVALLHGPVAIQGQYIEQRISRSLLPSASASGGYMQASWMITGEEQRYSRSSGLPSGPRIRKGDIGVELAGRFSWVDSNIAIPTATSASAADLAASLHLSPNYKLMLSGGQAWYGEDVLGNSLSQTTGVLRLVVAY